MQEGRKANSVLFDDLGMRRVLFKTNLLGIADQNARNKTGARLIATAARGRYAEV